MQDDLYALSDEDLEALLESGLAANHLRITSSWRPAALAHMRATAEAARLVLSFALDDEAEPAPVFRA